MTITTDHHLTHYTVQGTTFGFEDPRASVARDTVPGHAYEPLVAALLSRALREPGAAFVDIGALYGWFSCWAARHVPGLPVAAFEPEPTYADVMCRNIALNGVSVDVVTAALVDRDEPVAFHGRTVEGREEVPPWRRNYVKAAYRSALGRLSAEDTSDHIELSSHGDLPVYTAREVIGETLRERRRPATEVDDSPVVEAFTYDHWVRSGGFQPTVAKIDVHGGEGLVLRGMKESLPGLRHLLLELHTPDYLIDTDLAEVMDILVGTGMTLYELRGFRRSKGTLVPLTPERLERICDIDSWGVEDLYFMKFIYATRT